MTTWWEKAKTRKESMQPKCKFCPYKSTLVKTGKTEPEWKCPSCGKLYTSTLKIWDATIIKEKTTMDEIQEEMEEDDMWPNPWNYGGYP